MHFCNLPIAKLPWIENNRHQLQMQGLVLVWITKLGDSWNGQRL